MADTLSGKRVAILVANEGIEQVELTEPRKALEGAGATVELLAPESGEAQAFNHLDKADSFRSTAPSAMRAPRTTTR
jgi:protease I